MPTITAGSIVERARQMLWDAESVRWTEEALLSFLNAGQGAIVLARPEACVKNVALALAAGTKQALPADGVRLIDVVRNLGIDGLTPGRSVRIVEREVLDSQRPDWHAETQSQRIQHFCFDPRDQRHFYVYPPATAGTHVEAIYSASPPEIHFDEPGAWRGSVIGLDDPYQDALQSFILYRAYAMDSESAVHAQKAQAWYSVFLQSLNLQAQGDNAADPAAHNYPAGGEGA